MKNINPPLLMKADNSILVIVDIQTRLARQINDIDRVMQTNCALIKGATLLNVPVVFTEQYSKGLGPTDALLRGLVPDAPVIEKIYFNAAIESKLPELVNFYHRPDIIITGTEAHVCVLQTALGLKSLGHNIIVVDDAVGSRRESDKSLGLSRMKRAGCQIVSCEMVLFEWLERANTAAFRELLPTLRELGQLYPELGEESVKL